MTRILEVIIALLIVVALYVGIALALPSSRHVSHQLETMYSARQVFDVLNSFKRFGDWNPMRGVDPNVKLTFEGPVSGVGAKMHFSSTNKAVGEGTWEIVESVQDEKVVYKITNSSYGTDKVQRVRLEPAGRKVRMTWAYDVTYGWDLVGRYAGLYVPRTAGDAVKYSLGNLSALLATMPNFDYSGLEIETVELQAQDALIVATKAKRNITEVEIATDVAIKQLNAAIAANKLERAGAPRLVTVNYGDTEYEFNLVIPVRPEGSVPAPAEAADAAGSAEGEAAAEAPAETVAAVEVPAIDPATLKLSEPVTFGKTYAGRAVSAPYKGHGAALPLIRDMLRAYAAAHGEVLHDNAFEEQLSDYATTAAEQSEYKVYWPIR